MLFYFFGALAVIASLLVIAQRNPVYSVLLLIASFGALSGLYILLDAPFAAAIQIIVYAGAIMVLFVFVIMLLNVREEESRTDRQKYLKFLAAPLFLALLAEVAVVIRFVNMPAPAIEDPNTAIDPSQSLGTVESIAHVMFTDFVLPFEATSVLILMAIVGAMYLARRDSGEGAERIEQALATDAAQPPVAVHEDSGH